MDMEFVVIVGNFSKTDTTENGRVLLYHKNDIKTLKRGSYLY